MAVVERLLAVQAQDPRGMRLSVRSRSAGSRAATVDAALDDGSLVVSWLNRGTLHLVRSQDFWELHALTTPQLAAASVRRLEQEGVSPEQAALGAEVVEEAVAAGPRSRQELKAALESAGVPTAGQALVHVLLAATLRGMIVRGPLRNGDQLFVSAVAWVGEPPEIDVGEALARLARRYLAGHGPADAHDLARWAGIPLGRARGGFTALGSDIRQRPDGLSDLTDRPPPAPIPPPRLLGAFDPLLLGWRSREGIVGPHTGIVTTNGIFRPFALVSGRVVATWGLSGGVVTIRLLSPVDAPVVEALAVEAREVLRFLGLAEQPPRVLPVGQE